MSADSGIAVIGVGSNSGVEEGMGFGVYELQAVELGECGVVRVSAPKGTAVIERVLDGKTSVVRITERDSPASQIQRGDGLINPFIQPPRTVHVWVSEQVAGRSALLARMVELAVEVDGQATTGTNFLVFPDELWQDSAVSAMDEDAEDVLDSMWRECRQMHAVTGARCVSEKRLRFWIGF